MVVLCYLFEFGLVGFDYFSIVGVYYYEVVLFFFCGFVVLGCILLFGFVVLGGCWLVCGWVDWLVVWD